jgi:hypothetical protein
MPEHHARTRFRIHHADSPHEELMFVTCTHREAALDYASRVLGIHMAGLAADPVDAAGRPLHPRAVHTRTTRPASLEG